MNSIKLLTSIVILNCFVVVQPMQQVKNFMNKHTTVASVAMGALAGSLIIANNVQNGSANECEQQLQDYDAEFGTFLLATTAFASAEISKGVISYFYGNKNSKTLKEKILAMSGNLAAAWIPKSYLLLVYYNFIINEECDVCPGLYIENHI